MEDREQQQREPGGGGGEAPPDAVDVLKARLSESESRLKEKEAEALALRSEAAGLQERVRQLDGMLAAAVEKYRAAVVQASPDLLPEMIKGSSLPEIDESVRQAREVVARVKQELETGKAAARFPAGAPGRGIVPPALSPREKIERGIAR